MRRSSRNDVTGLGVAALLCAVVLALSACERAPAPKQSVRRARGPQPVTVTPVTGPVREVPAEEVDEEVDDEAAAPQERKPLVRTATPPASGAAAESARPRSLSLEELEKAVGAEVDLHPVQAAVLGEVLTSDAARSGPRRCPDDAAPAESSRNSPEEAGVGSERARPRLIVYDFESEFDGGPLGAKVADILTGHAARSGLFETFAELEQDEILAGHHFAPRHDTAATTVARHAREHFDADFVVWGRVTGTRQLPVLAVRYTSLRSWTVGADLAVAAHTEVCGSLHEIPVAADRILEKLAGRPLRPADVRVVRRMGPNLIENGSFNRKGPSGNVPGWESPLPDGAAAENGRLVLRLTKQVATTHGLGVYSDWIRVEPGAHYELSVRARAEGVTTIVWARGYAEFPARTPGERSVDGRRETFRHQFRPASQVEPDEQGWMAVTSKPFRPRHFRHEIRWMRVRLYAFGGGAGTAEFDEVVLRRVEVEGAGREDERMLKAFGEKVGGE